MPASSVSFNAPRSYDEQLAPITFGPFARELVARVPAGCAGPVLELACGTGAVTRLLRARLPRSTELVATDLSPTMLDYARARSGDAAGLRWQVADLQQLPFEDGSFATIVCGFGFMFAPDRALAFREARRVLASGGRLFFSVWDRIEENPHALANARIVEALFPGDPQMRFRLPYELHDEGVLRELLASAHFSEPAIETVRIPITGVDPHVLAEGQVRGTPRSALLLERGVALEGVIDATAALLAQAGGNPYSGHAQARLVQALAGAPMFKRIDHIELLTASPDRTIAFYTGVLGFRERERTTIPDTPSGPLDLVYLELGGTTVEVLCYPHVQAIPPRGSEQRLGWQCLALEVDDIDDALRSLKLQGVEAAWGPVKRADYARAEIRDPDGNPIELRQWTRRKG